MRTPGKWAVYQDGTTTNKAGDTVGLFRVMSDDLLVCESCYESDAALIAAAPGMAELLLTIVNSGKVSNEQLADAQALLERINK